MFNFKVGLLQDILSCEMENFDGPIWFLRDMSVGPAAFRKEYPLLSVRSTLNINHSNLTYLAPAGLTNTLVKGNKRAMVALYRSTG